MHTIEQYILATNNKNAGIVGFLRQLIFSCSKNITEKISYNFPFYYHHGRLCYVYAHDKGVSLCFCNGAEIRDPFNLLDTTPNKQIKSITFKDIKDVDYDKVIPLLRQSILLNEQKAGIVEKAALVQGVENYASVKP